MKRKITVFELHQIIKQDGFTIDSDKQNNYWIDIDRLIKRLNNR